MAISSCYTPRYVYSPAAQNVPVFTKKGDSKLAVYYSDGLSGAKSGTGTSITKSYNNGADIQTAFAVSSHFAIMANQYLRHEKNNGQFSSNLIDSATIRYNRSLTELAGGYFDPLDDNKQLIFQIYAGLGFGKFSFTDNGKNSGGNFYSKYFNTRIFKVFVQPSFTVGAKNNFSASLSAKINAVTFNNSKTDYSPAQLDSFKLDELGKSVFLFMEPSVINAFGFKKLPGIRFEIQFTMAALMSKKFVDYRSLNFSAGAMVNFAELKKKKTTH